MVGRHVDVARHRDPVELGDVVLEAEGLSARGDRGVDALRDVSVSVRAGEVVGVAGVAGNGQRELAEVLTGMRPLTAGTIRVAGQPLPSGDPRAAIRAGVAHVPEDRLTTGVAPSLSIAVERRAEVVPQQRGLPGAVPPAPPHPRPRAST